MDAINPTAVMTALAVAAVPIYHLLIKKPAKAAGDKPPLRRRSSILEELTSVRSARSSRDKQLLGGS